MYSRILLSYHETVTINPTKALNFKEQSLLERLLTKRGDNTTTFIAGTLYGVTSMNTDYGLTRYIDVKLTHSIILPDYNSTIAHVAAANIVKNNYYTKYGLAGYITIKKNGAVIFEPEKKKTVYTDLAIFDPLSFTALQGSLIGKGLSRLYKEHHINFYTKGINTITYANANDGTLEIISFKTKLNLLIRPREHHPNELRIEAFTSLLGRGRFGTVYKTATLAFSNNQTLFLKRHDRVIKEEMTTKASASKQEHAKVASLSDRGTKTPAIYKKNGKIFYGRVEREIQGIVLNELLHKNAELLDTNKRLWICKNLILSLIEIHHAGIIHRDIKPSNAIANPHALPKPTASHIDLGLAIWQDDDDTNNAAGTPIYMSPESLRQEKSTSTSDIYSLGVTLAEIWGATEHYDFESTVDQFEISMDEAIEILQSPSTTYEFKNLFSVSHDLNQHEIKTLSTLINRMIEKDPKHRIDLIQALIVVEKIILEREINLLPESEKSAHRKAFAQACQLRTELYSTACRDKLSKLTESDRSTKDISTYFTKIITNALRHNAPIHIFNNTVNIKIFAHLHSATEIKHACQQIFKDHEALYIKLSELKHHIKSIENEMKAAKINTISNQQTIFSITQPISICIETYKRKNLTLDNIATFVRKCTRYTAQAEQALTEFRNQIDTDINSAKINAEKQKSISSTRRVQLFPTKSATDLPAETQMHTKSSETQQKLPASAKKQ